jgi:hypothetical protein
MNNDKLTTKVYRMFQNETIFTKIIERMCLINTWFVFKLAFFIQTHQI